MEGTINPCRLSKSVLKRFIKGNMTNSSNRSISGDAVGCMWTRLRQFLRHFFTLLLTDGPGWHCGDVGKTLAMPYASSILILSCHNHTHSRGLALLSNMIKHFYPAKSLSLFDLRPYRNHADVINQVNKGTCCYILLSNRNIPVRQDVVLASHFDPSRLFCISWLLSASCILLHTTFIP